MRMTTVNRKLAPRVRAISLRRFFSTATSDRYFVEEKSSSEVIKSIIAVTASHKLRSDTVSGNLILLAFYEAV